MPRIDFNYRELDLDPAYARFRRTDGAPGRAFCRMLTTSRGDAIPSFYFQRPGASVCVVYLHANATDCGAMLPTSFRRADIPPMNRGDAAAGTRIFSGDESRRRRGRDADVPWPRVAAAPRLGRGYSVATSRGDAAAGTWKISSRPARAAGTRRSRGGSTCTSWRASTAATARRRARRRRATSRPTRWRCTGGRAECSPFWTVPRNIHVPARRRRDPPLRNIHVPAAASPRATSTE